MLKLDHLRPLAMLRPTVIFHMNGETVPKPVTANGDGGPDMSQLFMAKREEELARRDRSLAEFLVMLDGYKPVVSGTTH